MRVLACLIALALVGCASAMGASAPSAREEAFHRDLSTFIDRLRADPNAPPGFVVVAVDAERTLFEGAYGVRDLASGAPMTLDTPIYNASVTKAYTGLLAALLDAEGTLPLTATLRDVWPDASLPPPLDASQVNAARLLSHTGGFSAGAIIFRSVFTGDISAADVPQHLARYARPTTSSFSYSNTGPYIYSAMVEARTGQTWKETLQSRVLSPLGLTRTIARLEALPANEVAHCHGRLGGAWRALPHKPTALMNAAGGMYASGRDSGRFLRAFLSDGASAQRRIAAAVLRRTWERTSEQNREFLGMRRDGYGLGWDLGSFNGRRFVSRSGGHVGCRAMILFLPEENFGVAVLSVGDAAANNFNAAIFAQAIDYWMNDPAAVARAETRIAEYATAATAEMQRLAAAERALPRSAPVDGEFASAVIGVYENQRLGRIAVAAEGEGLVVRGGLFVADLRRVQGDSFILVSRDEVAHETFVFERAHGGIAGLMWDDDRYDRVR